MSFLFSGKKKNTTNSSGSKKKKKGSSILKKNSKSTKGSSSSSRKKKKSTVSKKVVAPSKKKNTSSSSKPSTNKPVKKVKSNSSSSSSSSNKSVGKQQHKTQVQSGRDESGTLITIRARGKDGMFRFEVKDSFLISTVCEELGGKLELNAKKIRIYSDGMCYDEMKKSKKLRDYGVKHGQMIFYKYDNSMMSKQEREEEKKRKMKEDIGDGSNLDNLGLRYIKKHWTLNEYLSHVDQKKVSIEMQKYPVASSLSLDNKSASSFHNYLRIFGFQKMRCGYLVGEEKKGKKPRVQGEDEDEDDDDDDSDSDSEYETDSEDEKKKEKEKKEAFVDSTLHDFKDVYVDAIYEPKQEGDPSGFVELTDENLIVVKRIAKCLNRKIVGYIFSYKGERKSPLLAHEILKIAPLQAENGEAFVTVTVGINNKGETAFEAYQLSKQCIELFQKGFLKVKKDDPTKFELTKKVEYERKLVNEIDCVMMLVNVPIKKHNGIFTLGFPENNRENLPEYRQTHQKAKMILNRRNQKLHQKLSDFHLLVYLSKILDVKSDYPLLCKGIISKNDKSILGFKDIIDAYLNV